MSAPGSGRGWVLAGGVVLLAGLATLGWSVRERARARQQRTAGTQSNSEGASASSRGPAPQQAPAATSPQPSLAPAQPGAAADAPQGGGQLDPGSRPPEAPLMEPRPTMATPATTPASPPPAALLATGEAVTPGTPSAPPEAVAPAEDRASRVRLTLALRDQLAELGRLQGGGDDKLAGAIEETRARLAEMESWATQQAITAAEWAAARSELERLRKQPTEPPSRPR